MISKSISNTKNYDLQLILEGINLKSAILSHAEYYPEKLKDKFFSQIFEIAQKWDSIFLDSIAPGKARSWINILEPI